MKEGYLLDRKTAKRLIRVGLKLAELAGQIKGSLGSHRVATSRSHRRSSKPPAKKPASGKGQRPLKHAPDVAA